MLPRTTSMWSIWPSGSSSHGDAFESARVTGAPSTSTSTWSELAPRMNRLVCEPNGPDCATLKLVNVRNRPGRSVTGAASMSDAADHGGGGQRVGQLLLHASGRDDHFLRGRRRSAACANAACAASSGNAATTTWAARDSVNEEVAANAATRLFTGAVDPV